VTKGVCVAAALFLLTGAGASPAGAQSKTIAGEVRWGRTFEENFGAGLTLDIQLLGQPEDSQNGIYVSILNKRLPKKHQFVVLPELIGGQESNFLGIFMIGQPDPKKLSAELRSVLDGVKEEGADVIYFTQTFSEAQLVKIDEANITLGHHGLSAAGAEAAHRVLDPIRKSTGVFKILDYNLSADPAGTEVPHITSVTFSFEPEGK